jgi:hypothetical protein
LVAATAPSNITAQKATQMRSSNFGLKKIKLQPDFRIELTVPE